MLIIMNSNYILIFLFLLITPFVWGSELSSNEVEKRLENTQEETKDRVIQDVLANGNADLVFEFLSMYNGGPSIIYEVRKLEKSDFKDSVYMAFLEKKWPVDFDDEGLPYGGLIEYRILCAYCIEFVNEKLGADLDPKKEENFREFMSLRGREKYAARIRVEKKIREQ